MEPDFIAERKTLQEAIPYISNLDVRQLTMVKLRWR
jgi:hypothetical protein